MLLLANLVKETHNATPSLEVEIACRLVGENETRTIKESSCDYYTLLLTTR
jgi:hypothetical protein